MMTALLLTAALMLSDSGRRQYEKGHTPYWLQMHPYVAPVQPKPKIKWLPSDGTVRYEHYWPRTDPHWQNQEIYDDEGRFTPDELEWIRTRDRKAPVIPPARTQTDKDGWRWTNSGVCPG